MILVHSQISNTLKTINDRCSRSSIDKARKFKVGDWVLVDCRNLTIKAGNNRSLMQKWIRPYQIIKPAGSHAYKLQLPHGIRKHHVVHATLLKPYKTNAANYTEQTDDE